MPNYTAIISNNEFEILKQLPPFSTQLYLYLKSHLIQTGDRYIPITDTNQNMADRFAKRPETISRSITKLHRAGLIDVTYIPTKNGIKRFIDKGVNNA